MYHEEKIINGVLHWRGLPDATFTAYTAAELTERLKLKESEIRKLNEQVNAYEEKWVDENV